MTHRLVHLEHHLLAVEDDGRDPGWARIGAKECGRLLGDTRRVSRQVEAVDVLPARL
jgi:hypothetical protein